MCSRPRDVVIGNEGRKFNDRGIPRRINDTLHLRKKHQVVVVTNAMQCATFRNRFTIRYLQIDVSDIQTLDFTADCLRTQVMDSFFDLSPSPPDEYNATLVITKTMHQRQIITSTVTDFVTVTQAITETVTATPTPLPDATVLEIPHFPKADTALTVIFTTCCLLLIVGIILRNKKRKIKAFNIPLILGSLCIRHLLERR